MTLSDREKLLLLVAPMAVILAGYASWFNLFERAKLQAITGAYQAAVDEFDKIGPYDAANAARRNRNLTDEVRRWAKRKQELESRADAVLGHSVVGNPIPNLKKEDFEITEDGKKQDIEVFEFEKLSNDLLTPVADQEGGPKQLEERVAPPPKPPRLQARRTGRRVGFSRRLGQLPAQGQAADGHVLRHDHHAAVRSDPRPGERHQVRQGTDDGFRPGADHGLRKQAERGGGVHRRP